MEKEKFICGECLEEMKKMPDGCIDFIFTSPPYADQIKDYGSTGIKIKPDQFDNWFIPRAKEMYRILNAFYQCPQSAYIHMV